MSIALNSPQPKPVEIEMRVSRLWPLFLKASHVLARVGLRPSPRVVAWVAGRCIKANVSGRWHRVVVPVDEVIASCVRAN